MSGLRRNTFARGSASGSGAEQADYRGLLVEYYAGARVFWRAYADARADDDCGTRAGRNPATAAISGRSRAGIFDAGPADVHAFRRRSAANSTGNVAGIATCWRAVCAGRAFDWIASARHDAADSHSGIVARFGKYDSGGGARSRHDSGSGLRARFGAWRRRIGRTHFICGAAIGIADGRAFDHRKIFGR